MPPCQFRGRALPLNVQTQLLTSLNPPPPHAHTHPCPRAQASAVGDSGEWHIASGVVMKAKRLTPDEMSSMVDRLCTIKREEDNMPPKPHVSGGHGWGWRGVVA